MRTAGRRIRTSLSDLDLALCAICRHFPGYTLETARDLSYGQIEALIEFIDLGRREEEPPERTPMKRFKNMADLGRELKARMQHGQGV